MPVDFFITTKNETNLPASKDLTGSSCSLMRTQHLSSRETPEFFSDL
jgi:hypothetical protein